LQLRSTTPAPSQLRSATPAATIRKNSTSLQKKSASGQQRNLRSVSACCTCKY
jgi:hypothetical protein